MSKIYFEISNQLRNVQGVTLRITKIRNKNKNTKYKFTANPHSTEYCRNMSEIFPIFHCN